MTDLAVADQKNIQGFADIELSRPVEMSGAVVTTLRMREPTVGDQLVITRAGGTPADQEMLLFANLCEVSPDDLKRLPMKDYRRVQRAYTSFLD